MCLRLGQRLQQQRNVTRDFIHLLHDVLQLFIGEMKLLGEIDWPGSSVTVAVVDALVQPVPCANSTVIAYLNAAKFQFTNPKPQTPNRKPQNSTRNTRSPKRNSSAALKMRARGNSCMEKPA